MFGLGDDAVSTNTANTAAGSTDTGAPAASNAVPGGFVAGATLWESPGLAFDAVKAIASNPSTAFAQPSLLYTAGIIAVPLLVLMLLSGGGGRRF